MSEGETLPRLGSTRFGGGAARRLPPRMWRSNAAFNPERCPGKHCASRPAFPGEYTRYGPSDWDFHTGSDGRANSVLGIDVAFAVYKCRQSARAPSRA